MSELSERVAMEVRGLSDHVLLAVIAHDEDTVKLAAKEAARRMLAERPRS